MKIELSWDERRVLTNLLNDEIKSVKRGDSVYGDEHAQLEVLELFEGIRVKISDD